MNNKIHEVDPDGDVMLILKSPNAPFAVWDDVELTNAGPSPPKLRAMKKKENKIKKRECKAHFAMFGSVDPGHGPQASPEHESDIEDSEGSLIIEDLSNLENIPAEELPEATEGSIPADVSVLEAHEDLLDNTEPATLDKDSSTSPAPHLVSDSGEEIRFRLSSKHLVLASTYFRKVLSGSWKESISSPDSCYIVGATEWDSEAMLVLMNIIHGWAQRVPRSLNLEMLSKVAVLVDYYDCHEVVALHVECWIRQLDGKLPRKDDRDMILWLWVSWAFQCESIYETITKVALMECKGPLDTLGLPISQRAVGE